MRSRHRLAWPSRAAIAPAVKALFDTWKCVPMLNGVHILVTGWWVRAIPGEWPSTSVSPALISLWLHCNYPRHASHCTPTKVTKPTPPTMLSLSSSWLRSVGSFRGHFHHSCPVRQGIKDITPHLMTTRNIRQRHGSVFQFNICSPHPPPSCFSPKFFLPPRFIDGAAQSSSFWGEERQQRPVRIIGQFADYWVSATGPVLLLPGIWLPSVI